MRHDILIQCHQNYIEMKNINYMPEIDILRNSSRQEFGCPEWCSLRVWVSKRRPDTLLAKTMSPSIYDIFVRALHSPSSSAVLFPRVSRRAPSSSPPHPCPAEPPSGSTGLHQLHSTTHKQNIYSSNSVHI